MNNKRPVFVLVSIFFLVILIIAFKDFVANDVYEEVYTIDSNVLDSGDNSYMYDVVVNDDTITFYDAEGNSVIYVFNADKLENVFNLYNAKSEAEAKRIAAYYTRRIGDGEISKVSYKGTTVSVTMDMECFSEYKNYSKSDIEKILLQNTNRNEMEE